ncbi:MAG TPA: hypothetical protein VFE15_16120 [Marmoricola sp.]|jgi:hypothetical protein|nr:hypothetical protein [Marmoricola sp.]
MKKAALASLAVLLLTVSACGGGTKASSTKDGKVAVSTMVKAITSANGGLLTKSKATCVATAFVDDEGTARLKAAKVVGTDFSYNDNGANVTTKTSAAYSEALLKCVDDKAALAAFQKSMETAYGASTAGVLSTTNVDCLVSDFVTKAGVPELLSNRVITDAGVFNTAGPKYDTKTATNLANAIVGCVDYLRAEAQAAAKTDKKLDETALEKCLKANITETQIRDSVVATITNSTGANAEVTAINNKASSCEKSSKR